MIARRFVLASAALIAVAAPASAYPEFQKFSQQNSGRTTNCAMCHTHPDGPDGAAHGQIGSLKPDELARLNRARAAFEPGQEVDSPILNAFGDRIVGHVGKTRLLQLRSQPGDLAAALDPASDLDGDGVADASEYAGGTHPLKRTSGDPWRLFATNFVRYRFHILMLTIATALGVFGLANLLRGSHAATVEADGADRAPREA